MLCQGCHRVTNQRLVCRECRRLFRPAPERIVGGVRLIAAFEHTGPAKTLVHHLKYRGLTGYADLVAAVVASRVPRLPLVPVPRTWSRRFRYGVDPAALLADRLSSKLGVPVIRQLEAPLHTPRRAGGDHFAAVTGLALRRLATTPVVLVDDVVTTGATLSTVVEMLGHSKVRMAVAANAVPEVSSLPAGSQVLP